MSSAVFILLFCLAWLNMPYLIFGESHYEYINFYQTLSKTVCETYYEQVCEGWWTGHDCDPIAKQKCHTEYYVGTGLLTRCQAGWQPYPGNCDIPICNPPCQGGKSCINPNVCGCLKTSGGLCSIRPCSDENNCYPGTCNDANLNCMCPSMFAETNCIRILQIPDITSCKVQLYNESQTLFKEAFCASAGVDPQITWIPNQPLSKMKVIWEAKYTNAIGMPDKTYAPHVQNAPVPLGIKEASFNVSFSNNAGNTRTLCTITQTLPSEFQCDTERQWSDFGVTPQHNQTFTVSASAQLGGHKTGSSDGNIYGSFFPQTEYLGDPNYRDVQFKFDLMPPTHCLTDHDSQDCLQYAIFLDQDIRTNKVIEPKIYNWTDDGSGLFNYHIEVFYMQTAPPNNELVNAGGPLIVSDIKPSQNNFIYICTTPGVYSIELTVQDQAGNRAMARELFIYTGDSQLTSDPNKPVFIQEANPESGYAWITNIDYPQGGGFIKLTLIWTDHFRSEAQFNGAWAAAAKLWPSDRIDDRYTKVYGARTVHPITNMPNGIVGYAVAFTVDEENGGVGLSPDNWTSVEATKDRYTLQLLSLVDGNALVVWLRCADATGSMITEAQVIHVDVTPPEIKSADFKLKSIDEYTSRVDINVSDISGGIKNISFEIYDRTIKQSIHRGTVQPHMRDPPPPNNERENRALEQPCTSDDKTCYCIPHGECYNYIQEVSIDHCWIDLLAGDFFEFRFNVTNLASLKTKEQSIELGQLSDIPCRPSPGLSGGEIAGIVIGCILGVVLIAILVMLIRIYVFKKPPPSRFLAVQRTMRNKLGRVELDENIVYESADRIVQPHNKQESSNGGKDVKAYSYSGSDDGETPIEVLDTIISRKLLELGETLSDGRFAVIRKAYLKKGNKTITVVAKSVTGHPTKEDMDLLERKILTFQRLPPNPNVIEYLGKVEQNENEGPIMVLEFCEISLKEWLDNITKVTSEVLEEMLMFVHDIAKGVLHLHSNKIIHRRLAVRNVLLRHQLNGFVAKLIGFGPSREENKDTSEQVAVPIKWLAPETLETLGHNVPVYDEKTDAWSFGVTVWEIYSKGETPYSDKRSAEVKRLVKKGLTLALPPDCPPDLFNSAVSPCWNLEPKKRPDFARLCSNIGRFHSGDQPPGYYAASETTGYYDQSQLYADQSNGVAEIYSDAK